MLTMIAAAFAIGIVVSIPPGPVVIATGQRAISRGFWHAITFNMGSILADAFYVLLVYFGVSALLAENNTYRFILWTLGGAWLCWMGIDAIRTPINLSALNNTAQQMTRWRNFRSGLIITLFNPMTIVSWIALAGNFYNTVWREDWPPVETFGLVAVAAMLVGAFAWVIFISMVLSSVRHKVSPRGLKVLSVISGAFLLFYGLSAWVSAVQLLLAPAV